MFCFRKNNDQEKFTSLTGLVVILTVFFMVLPFAGAAHIKHGTRGEKMNHPSSASDDAIHGTAEQKKAFDSLDINGDGYLTIDDYQPNRFKPALVSALPWYREIISTVVLESRKEWDRYSRLDINGDGQVAFIEFIVPETGEHPKRQHQ